METADGGYQSSRIRNRDHAIAAAVDPDLERDREVGGAARSHRARIRSHAACAGPREPKAAAPKPIVSLLSCRGPQTARSLNLLDRDACSVVGAHDWPAPQRNGEVAFENLDAGSYVIEFTFAGLPPIREPLRVGRFDQETLNLDVDYTTLFGRVTVGGEKVPSPVRVSFDFTHAVYTNDDGDYSVVLNKPLAADHRDLAAQLRRQG